MNGVPPLIDCIQFMKSRSVYSGITLAFFLVIAFGSFFSVSDAIDRETSGLDILHHEWHSKEVWERIGKTQFIWKATVINRSNIGKRVFVYYALLDEYDRPLAQNVANQVIDSGQTAEITGDSYINTTFLPMVKNSRATLRVGFPD